jgi:hypothetical protein
MILQILLLDTILGLSTPHMISRIDRKSAYSNDFTVHNFEEKPARILRKQSTNQPAFLFQFSCNVQSVGQERCQLAKTGFENAGQRIAQALNIKQTVVVQAIFHSFCQSQRNSNCRDANNTLGRASSAAYFPATKSGSADVYFYPQSLVKQLKKSSDLTYASADIFAEFNSDFPFYFTGSRTAIRPNDTDFEFVVAHELTHGLGVDSGWVQYSGFYNLLTTNAGYLAPLPFAQGNSDQSSIVSTFSPLTIYDSFLRSRSENFADLGRNVLRFRPNQLRLPNFISAFESSPQMQSARQAMSGASGGQDSLRFQAPSGQAISLHSPSRFQQGTSVTHVDSRLSNTLDFLMIPAITPLLGQRLDQIMQRLNATSIYGPGTMAMMSSIGWPTRENPEPIAINIISDYGASRSGAPKYTYSLGMLALIILIVM